MTSSKLVLLSVLGLVLATGCSQQNAETTSAREGTPGSNESLLIDDGNEAADLEEDVEAGVEDPLSGAEVGDPGTPAYGATDDEVMGKVRKNPGLFFQPAGCITTTVEGNKATHIFADCTGPHGILHFTGTVVSTYTREPGKLTIKHQATNFRINGATISGERAVVYTRSGTVVTKTRDGNWTGTTKKGNALSHTASFQTTWNASTKCITRDGAATTSVGNREFDWAISNFKRCGIGGLGCPESGTITLSRTKGERTASVTIEFLGGPTIRITGPQGGQSTAKLVCRAT